MLSRSNSSSIHVTSSNTTTSKILDSLQKPQSDKHLQPDQLMLGKKLGEGTSSVVYAGMLWGHQQTVAVKKFKVNKHALYNNEKSILEKLSTIDGADKYLIKYYGYIDDSKNKSLVIEYMDGGDLIEYFGRTKYTKPTEQSAVQFAATIAHALDFIHSYDIIHCDVKSENIVLTLNGEVKLCDFGFAKTKDEIKNGIVFRGTSTFVAPELFDSMGKYTPYSEKSDIYAYAFVLFEYTNLKTPYSSKLSDGEILMLAYVNNRPEIPSTCPQRIVHLIKHCWSQDPKERPFASQVISEIETTPLNKLT